MTANDLLKRYCYVCGKEVDTSLDDWVCIEKNDLRDYAHSYCEFRI